MYHVIINYKQNIDIDIRVVTSLICCLVYYTVNISKRMIFLVIFRFFIGVLSLLIDLFI